MSCAKYDFEICGGETFLHTVRWASGPYVSKAITSISRAVPVSIVATAHGLPDGWPAAVVGSQGMTEINAGHYPPWSNEWQTATVADVNTVTFNRVNSSGFSAHTANTGFLVYPSPVNLANMAITFKVYDNPEFTGTPLVSLTEGAGVLADNTAKTIDVEFETAAAAWNVGYYKLVAVDSTTDDTQHILEGAIVLT